MENDSPDQTQTKLLESLLPKENSLLGENSSTHTINSLSPEEDPEQIPWVMDSDPSTGEKVVVKLPEFFTGATGGIVLPPYGSSASAPTLDSRLTVLGRFPSTLLEPFAFPIYLLGSSVFKFSMWGRLYILPSFHSIWGVRRELFTRCGLIFLIAVRLWWQITEIIADCDTNDWQNSNSVQLYSAIIFVTVLSLWIEFQLKNWPEPPGLLGYLRSLSPPKTEEFFFSYSWSVRPGDIRTLARGLWNSGVGVWIDTLKLCSGDSIGTTVRTMVKCSYKTIVFLTPQYLASRNCCIEAYEASLKADADPKTVIVCRLQGPLPSGALEFWEKKGVLIVGGLFELMEELDLELRSSSLDQYHWWRSHQNEELLSGIPQTVVLNDSIPLCWGGFKALFRVFLPSGSVSLGPYWLSGDCKHSGLQSRASILLVVLLVSLAGTGFSLHSFGMEAWDHDKFGFALIVLLSIVNCVPILETSKIFDTRIEMSKCLVPLTSTSTFTKYNNSPLMPAQVIIQGDRDHPIVTNLNAFLKLIGHLYDPSVNAGTLRGSGKFTAQPLPIQASPGSSPAPSPSLSRRHRGDSSLITEIRGVPLITVYVLSSIAERNRFYEKRNQIDYSRSIFIWAGPPEVNPFGPGDNPDARSWFSDRLTFLANREGESLAEEIFSAIGIRVASALYKIPTEGL